MEIQILSNSKKEFLTEAGQIQLSEPTVVYELKPVIFYQNDYQDSFNFEFKDKSHNEVKTATNKGYDDHVG